MKKGAETERVELFHGQSEFLSEGQGDALHTIGMACGVGILGLDGCVQAFDRLERALLETLVGLAKRDRAFAEGSRLAAQGARGAPRENNQEAPEEEEHGGGSDPDLMLSIGDRRIERRGVGIDLIGAEDLLAFGIERRVDL